MLTNTKDILIKARNSGYAVPSPDCIDLDSTRTFIEVAEKLSKPIILAFAESLENVISIEEAVAITKVLTENVSVPVALHLDHGVNLQEIKRAVDLGFTSVMIDASSESFDDNVRKTREIVDYAHARGVSVEAELGHVGQASDYQDYDNSGNVYTETADASQFVLLTGVDFLAVSIGTAHGSYPKSREPKLNFERLGELFRALGVPLVLHGGSGSGDDNLARCAREGISKVNLFTDFLKAAMRAVESEKPVDYLSLKSAANKGMADMLIHYYNVLG